MAGSDPLFECNPNYWDAPKPYLNRIILPVIVDPAARAAALETGEIDIGANPVPLADVARLQANPKLVVDSTTYACPGPQQQLFFNLQDKILQNQKVRLAVAHALDLRKLMDIALFGYGDISTGAISVALPEWYDPSIKPYPFDPKLVQGLLDEAGYRRGADGVRLKVRLAHNPFLPSSFGFHPSVAGRSRDQRTSHHRETLELP